jgi:hypothetical protein
LLRSVLTGRRDKRLSIDVCAFSCAFKYTFWQRLLVGTYLSLCLAGLFLKQPLFLSATPPCTGAISPYYDTRINTETLNALEGLEKSVAKYMPSLPKTSSKRSPQIKSSINKQILLPHTIDFML